MSVFVLNVRDDEAVYAALEKLLRTGAIAVIHKVRTYEEQRMARIIDRGSGR